MGRYQEASASSSDVDLREHVRVDTVLPLSYWSDSDPMPLGLHPAPFNLSGGGLRLTTAQPLHIGDGLSVRIGLPDGVVAARGRVVRVEGQTDQTARVSLQFTGIGSCDQERLVQYIYDL